jgi:phosphoribosylglycinamide formyltransferase-1
MVSQNGWLPMTPDNVIEEYNGAIFNQHPGLLPDFGGDGMYGKRVHAATLAFRKMTKGDMVTEATAQRVSKGKYDAGAVFANSEIVPIMKDDNVDELQQRVLPVEHKVQIAMLKDAVAGKLVEVRRESIISIIKPGQEVILEYAKKVAIALYPHG